MKNDHKDLLLEIHDMLKTLVEGQERLINEICELKAEQKKLQEEVRLSNFVLNNIAVRNEILN